MDINDEVGPVSGNTRTSPREEAVDLFREPRPILRAPSFILNSSSCTSHAGSGDQFMHQEDPDESDDNEKAKVYTYFDQMSKKVLKEIGRYWGRRSNGNRPYYVLRNYRFVIYKKKMGRDIL